MPVWNVRDAFTEARDAYFLPRSVDGSLSGVEQALCGEAAGAGDRAINALGQDDLWPQGQRAARYADCQDKVLALKTVNEAHYGWQAQGGFSDTTLLYDGMDLLSDASVAANRGLTTFVSSVEPKP